MSQFHVTQVNPNAKAWTGPAGEMLSYYIKGSLDGGSEEQVQINTIKAKPKVPCVGEIIECEVTRDHPQYGKTLKRTQAVPQGAVSGGSARGSQGSYHPSPASEIPYLSLKSAVEFASSKVSAKLDIDGAGVVAMAQVFQRYLEGQILKEVPQTGTPPEWDMEDLEDTEFTEGGA